MQKTGQLRRNKRLLHLERLELRCLLSGSGGSFAGLDEIVPNDLLDGEISPASAQVAVSASLAPASAAEAVVQGAIYSLSEIPPLHSNPLAAAKLFLDFDGAPAQTWGYYNADATPAYDRDGDPTTFSDVELNSIRSVWAQLAEAYSPFEVDVTTVDPGNLDDLQTLAAVVGGDGLWAGGGYAGLAHLGGFYNTASNVVYVFSDNLFKGHPLYTADAIAHEVGHGFGLNHQSSYDDNGFLISEYNMGDSQKAPIMGAAYSAIRGLWWYGPNPYGPASYQDDLALLTDGRNGWGYRADDWGDTLGAAEPMTISDYAVSAAGIIERTADQDVFAFTTAAGSITLTGAVAVESPMLDLRLDLYTEAGTLVASADSAALGETITATVPAGCYRLVVASHGSYGDIGQYTISGTVVTATQIPDAPASPQATAVSSHQVDVSWADVAGETSYRIERSLSGTSDWIQAGTVPADVLVFHDGGLSAGTEYYYRVSAVNASGASAPSAVVSTTTPAASLAAPTDLRATEITKNSVKIQWNDNSTGESGFKIERSTDGRTWKQIDTVASNATTYTSSGLKRKTTYYFRVSAYNVTANSDYSNVLSVKTLN